MKKVVLSLMFSLALAFAVVPATHALDCGTDGKCPNGYTANTDPVTSKCTCANMFGGDDVKSVGDASGLGNTTLPNIIANVVKIILGLFGVVATVIIVYGGVKWMTSQGDTNKIDSAKKVMIAGGVGMLLIISGYAITAFLISGLGKVVGA